MKTNEEASPFDTNIWSSHIFRKLMMIPCILSVIFSVVCGLAWWEITILAFLGHGFWGAVGISGGTIVALKVADKALGVGIGLLVPARTDYFLGHLYENGESGDEFVDRTASAKLEAILRDLE